MAWLVLVSRVTVFVGLKGEFAVAGVILSLLWRLPTWKVRLLRGCGHPQYALHPMKC